MINYEKYAELRNSRGLKDSDIAKITNIPQSTFTAWKKGDYMPKADKMEKIAAALDPDKLCSGQKDRQKSVHSRRDRSTREDGR